LRPNSFSSLEVAYVFPSFSYVVMKTFMLSYLFFLLTVLMEQ